MQEKAHKINKNYIKLKEDNQRNRNQLKNQLNKKMK